MNAYSYDLKDYLFSLPQELIAQHPTERRDHSRLLVVDRASGHFFPLSFYEIEGLLDAGDGLIFNDTKVIPAVFKGTRLTGGACQLLLVRQREGGLWEAMVKPGKRLGPGAHMVFADDLAAEVVEVVEGGHRLVRFHGDLEQGMRKYGQMPLPPYIRRDEAVGQDRERYQTVYARNPGAVAAPTAGLHFTPELLNRLAVKGVRQDMVTLHVGPGTFKPVQSEDIRHHPMHSERYYLSEETIQGLRGEGMRVAVGTTTLRTLEGAAAQGELKAGWGETSIFIYPGYEFRVARALLTNFHLPGSTLFMLVCAFAGHELAKEAYAYAVAERFRFFSYGDAMLIL